MIGAVFGSLAMLWSIIIDVMIVNKYSQDGVAISILWQAPTYMFLGAGEVFTICSAYDAAFNVAPNNLKVLASAINLFLIGALPKFISQLLVFSCTSFFHYQGWQQGHINALKLCHCTCVEVFSSSPWHLSFWNLSQRSTSNEKLPQAHAQLCPTRQ